MLLIIYYLVFSKYTNLYEFKLKLVGSVALLQEPRAGPTICIYVSFSHPWNISFYGQVFGISIGYPQAQLFIQLNSDRPYLQCRQTRPLGTDRMPSGDITDRSALCGSQGKHFMHVGVQGSAQTAAGSKGQQSATKRNRTQRGAVWFSVDPDTSRAQHSAAQHRVARASAGQRRTVQTQGYADSLALVQAQWIQAITSRCL